ncbi:hypothetical protein BN946_scf184766.g37 [Trametes cinnabarina]|uniref:Uncharacterized protein n=1 Tax=Pycnoporus cinnabarinus TaxID=5643 RepID=A0A060S5U4_PYCCI|nr:hypothetical protein BN946_scf184766.g37 [Trametes cinnabarina]
MYTLPATTTYTNLCAIMASGSRRQPLPIYKDHDGFTERILLKMTGAVPPAKCNLHAVAAHPEKASPEDLRELRDAVQRRQFVEDIMRLDGTYFPGIDAIKKANDTKDTSATLKERIQEVQKRHIQEVRTLYEWQARDYYDEVLDLSRSKADIDDPDLEAFYRATRLSFAMANTFDDDLDRLNHAYAYNMIELVRQRNAHRLREETEQQRRDRQFPASIDDFHAIRNKDVQVRVARFLTGDDAMRERMMSDYGWAWRQVAPLVEQYNLTQSFKYEVQTLLRDIEATDPRKARMGLQNAATA